MFEKFESVSLNGPSPFVGSSRGANTEGEWRKRRTEGGEEGFSGRKTHRGRRRESIAGAGGVREGRVCEKGGGRCVKVRRRVGRGREGLFRAECREM